MKPILFSLITILAMGSTAQSQNNECKDCIPWNENRRLRWSDFKASPKKLSPNEALTESGMSIELNCDGKTSTAVVKCYFNPHKSWTKDKESVQLLSHEQLHFDITELFVRRLRKQLAVFGNDCDKLSKHIQEYYDRNYKDFVAYQDDYDRESQHSINTEKQAYWQQKVARELEELKPYASLAKN
ncbi:MAG: DUF922 domain-containing protein [Flavobacteriales bacterium]|nr:DUF922 domain-containing protein [Flavobacteriales bacterium]